MDYFGNWLHTYTQTCLAVCYWFLLFHSNFIFLLDSCFKVQGCLWYFKSDVYSLSFGSISQASGKKTLHSHFGGNETSLWYGSEGSGVPSTLFLKCRTSLMFMDRGQNNWSWLFPWTIALSQSVGRYLATISELGDVWETVGDTTPFLVF